MASLTLYVAGMHCLNCETFIEWRLAEGPGVTSAQASLRTEKVTVEHDGTVMAHHCSRLWLVRIIRCMKKCRPERLLLKTGGILF